MICRLLAFRTLGSAASHLDGIEAVVLPVDLPLDDLHKNRRST